MPTVNPPNASAAGGGAAARRVAARPAAEAARNSRRDSDITLSSNGRGRRYCHRPAPHCRYSTGDLLLREQGVDVLVVELLLALVRVDHQGLAVRGGPDHVVAQPENVLHPRLLLEDAEVGVALGLDDHHLLLGLKPVVDPEPADLDAVAAVDRPHSGQAEFLLLLEVLADLGEVHAELAGLVGGQ